MWEISIILLPFHLKELIFHFSQMLVVLFLCIVYVMWIKSEPKFQICLVSVLNENNLKKCQLAKLKLMKRTQHMHRRD